MGHFNFIIQQSCHNSWDAFFTSQPVRNELTKIEKSISSQVIFPAPNDVFKVFQCDLEKLKVVIMGQDPYPQPNVATGRSFEVGNISSWGALRRKNSNASLRNILKLLHHNKRMTSKVQGIKVVMNDNKFTSNILPPNKIFANLEQQGVLFLNAALTCPQGSTKKSNAHAKIWSDFTKLLLDFIDANKKNLYWLLWGEAKKHDRCIRYGTKYYSYHPRNNLIGPKSFYSENHFSKIKCIHWA